MNFTEWWQENKKQIINSNDKMSICLDAWSAGIKAGQVEPVVIVKTARGALLPCPFCGSKPKIAITSQIKCSNINCVMSSHVMHDTLWNQRVNSRFSE